MNYNNFFRWSGLKTYTCNICGEVVELSDNARYNLIGNGVVPQVVRVIIEEKIKDL